MNKRHMNFKVLGRLLGYVIRHYKFSCLITLVLIILSSVANVSVSLFVRVLIDDYITPLSQSAVPDYAPLLKILIDHDVHFPDGCILHIPIQPHSCQCGTGNFASGP